MGAVEAVAVDEAADTTHGPEGIGELRVRLTVQGLCRIEEKTQLMTPETCSQWLHLQNKKGVMHHKHM